MSTNGIIQTIGDILVDYVRHFRRKLRPFDTEFILQQFPHMSPYIRFCSRQLNAAALIQQRHENVPEFRELLKRCQMHPKVKGMPLTSYLLKPMQRITKYPLLLGRLLRATAQQDVETRETLREAQAKVESYLTAINSVSFACSGRRRDDQLSIWKMI